MDVRQMLGGRYKLLSELGSGGMAVVWRAQDVVLGRPVAVKLLAARYAEDEQSRARIRDEARAAAALSHPNIAQVYDYGEATHSDPPLPYVVMELINGPTLQQRVAAGPLPPRTVFRICGEVAAALAAAHADGLVHRDIKMANIMVTATGAKVVDFGIAAAVGRSAPEEMLVGTPAYLAPERLTGDAVVPASDVYALGVLLYRLLAHASPWTVETTTQMLQAHVYVEPAPLPRLPGVPPRVAELIGNCLRKEPDERPTAAEVSAMLADAAEAAHQAAPEAAAVPRARIADSEEPSRRGGEEPGRRGSGEPSRWGGEEPGRRWEEETSTVVGGAFVPIRSGRPQPVRPRRKRKLLLAGGGLAIVTAAVLVGWSLSDGPAVSPKGEAAPGSPVPVVPGGSRTPRSSPVGQPVRPSATQAPSRPTVTATGPATSSKPAPAGPGGVSTSSATPTPSRSTEPTRTVTPPPPGGKELTSPGGSVFAQCVQGRAAVIDLVPANGYEGERVNSGSRLTSMVIFASDRAWYRMTITCVAGSPTAVVLPL
ncbi:MAG: protein kinase [Actinoplanes sp.]